MTDGSLASFEPDVTVPAKRPVDIIYSRVDNGPDSMARPIRSPDDLETSDKLLAVARGEFAKRGFEGARLSDIAEEVGIKRPSLLYHYPTKQDLYSAVVNRAFADLGTALEGATQKSGASFVERFDELVKKLVAFFDERPDVATLILRELVDDQGPGQLLLLDAGVPLLLKMERFVREEGDGVTRRDLPIRQALLQTFAAVLVKSASGRLREPLWGK